MSFTIHTGDCRAILPNIREAQFMVTDPPYGIGLSSGMDGRFGSCGVAGDQDTALRDAVVRWAAHFSLPSLMFGSWRVPKPEGTRAVLTWEKGEHVGMGDLSLPWKPNTEEIYVLGKWPSSQGRRGSVLKHHAIAHYIAINQGRTHPTEKPVALMLALMQDLPKGAVVVDPFCGTGATGVACIKLGLNFIGIELEEKYAAIARSRCAEAVDSCALFAG